MNKDMGWQLGRRAMIGTLILGAAWGSIMVLAVLFGREASVIGDMFAGVVAMMVTTLGVLVGGKGWKEFSRIKNGSQITRESTTEKEVYNVANPKGVPTE